MVAWDVDRGHIEISGSATGLMSRPSGVTNCREHPILAGGEARYLRIRQQPTALQETSDSRVAALEAGLTGRDPHHAYSRASFGGHGEELANS